MSRSATVDATIAGYERLAAEYYDPQRHPTCAALREATQLALERLLDAGMRLGRALEVGAGHSLVAECLMARGVPLTDLILSDGAPSMLKHSQMYVGAGATSWIAPAGDTLPEGPFDTIFCCLGDPYNGPELWRAVAHRLRIGGICFYSTPSHDWVQAFRSSDSRGVAEFLLDDRPIDLRSVVLPVPQQQAMIEASGLHLLNVEHIPRSALKQHSAPKLSPIGTNEGLNVVTCYFVTSPVTAGVAVHV